MISTLSSVATAITSYMSLDVSSMWSTQKPALEYVSSTSTSLDDFVPQPSLLDNSTYANVDDIKQNHLHLNFDIDFDTQTYQGAITLDLHADNTVDFITLDTWYLDIQRVKWNLPFEAKRLKDGGVASEDGYELNWKVTTPNSVIGSVLSIAVPRVYGGSDSSLTVYFATTENSMAMSWLTAAQTAGKTLPYLFSQCESINCRSVAPMQDTPGVKTTYSARVLAKSEFTVKMSANQTYIGEYNSTHTETRFYNQIPIPCYLVAIAVGNIEYQSLGYRVGVLTEPEMMESVAWELSSLETLLDTTEDYLTPYIWGNYTVLVLPPSFPFGGMENPLLTFASPTIIVGDKSQVYVATHEIAHSWTGNDVTCQDWESFWLNEGFTVFNERKVSSILHGVDFAQTEALLGNASLWGDMSTYGLDNTYSSIHPVLQGDNPDNAFSEVPYEKGFQFLHYMESVLGEDNMQAFLRYYILQHEMSSITMDVLRATFETWVQDNYKDAYTVNNILGQIQWDTWIFQSTLAPVNLDFTTKASNESAQLANEYIDYNCAQSPAGYEDYNSYDSNTKVVFHTALTERFSELTTCILGLIDSDLSVTDDPDPEVKQRWQPLGLQLQYETVYDASHTFISTQGRIKYLTPNYSALMNSGQSDLANQWFDENKDFYHPLAVSTLEPILGITSAKTLKQYHLEKQMLSSKNIA